MSVDLNGGKCLYSGQVPTRTLRKLVMVLFSASMNEVKKALTGFGWRSFFRLAYRRYRSVVERQSVRRRWLVLLGFELSDTAYRGTGLAIKRSYETDVSERHHRRRGPCLHIQEGSQACVGLFHPL